MDFIIKLPHCQGFDSIWVVTDHLTQAAHFIPIKKSTNSFKLAKSFLSSIFQLHIFPRLIVSDWGTTFISSFFSLLMRLMGSKSTPSTAYHPKTNGLMEWTSYTLESHIWAFCSYQLNDWVNYLPLAKFSFNNSTNSSMNTTPFFANMGLHSTFEILITTDMNNPAAQELSVCLNHIHQELHAELAHSNKQMSIYYDHKCSSPPDYSTSDLVLLLCHNTKTTHPSKKLDYHCLGPFEVLEKCGWSTYLLKLLPSLSHLHPVLNVDLLEPYLSPSIIEGQTTPWLHICIQHDHHYQMFLAPWMNYWRLTIVNTQNLFIPLDWHLLKIILSHPQGLLKKQILTPFPLLFLLSLQFSIPGCLPGNHPHKPHLNLAT